MNTEEIADLIISRLKTDKISKLKKKYKTSSNINYLIIENLLPYEIASTLDKKFPARNLLNLRSETQEKKYIAVEWDSSSQIVENCLYAFQKERVINLFSKICNIKDLSGDKELYAGGVSYMDKDCFLNPHIDNSHDRLKEKYRRLNLLYYVNENWDSEKDGGELLLFPEGVKSKPIIIPPKFNSLVVMRTDCKSLHGVNKVNSISNVRKCISNYYFSSSSPTGNSYYHSTSFRGFKDEKIKDVYLRLNAFLRTYIKSNTGNFFGKVFNTGHHRKNN